MSRRSTFAVLRLITNSNFVGYSTGNSAGFAPLKIRSHICAALPIHVWKICSIRHQTASSRIVPQSNIAGSLAAVAPTIWLTASAAGERIGRDYKASGRFAA